MSIFRENLVATSTNTKNRPTETQVLGIITRLCSTKNGWFISGSYANRLIKKPNDIDVYFESEQLFKSVLGRLTNNDGVYIINDSKLSLTVQVRGFDLPIQFIKIFGTPRETIDRFDLNVCKKVLLPNGQYYEDPTSNNRLSIHTVNYDTFSRFFKYYSRLYPETTTEEYVHISKRLIDLFITNNDIVIDTYTGMNNTSTVNEQLFNYFNRNDTLRPYLIESALQYSPSLLI